MAVIPAGPGAAQAARHEAPLWQQALRLRSQLTGDSADGRTALRAAEFEIAIGMPARALSVLSEHLGDDSTWGPRGFTLRGEAEYALARFENSANSFSSALDHAGSVGRGVLAARAGIAFAKAGQSTEAARYLADAAEESREFSGWLASRRADLCDDTTRAFALLAAVPPEIEPLAILSRGRLRAAAGDTGAAITTLENGGYPVEAAELALLAGDSAAARRLAYVGLEHGDTSVARAGLTMVEGGFPPASPDDFLALSRASQRLRSLQDAARYAGAAVSAGDSSAQTLVFWGDLLASTRSRQRALAAYGQAASMDGETSVDAEFRYGRMLLNLGRVSEGMARLTSFVRLHPDHGSVPRALYGMADRHRRDGRAAKSDSLNALVVSGWPRNGYASRARMDMAASALRRGDTATAVRWYRAEIEVRGTQRNVAQYRLGGIRAAAGDTVAARAIWAALARSDSLGYYGMIARTAANMPPMEIEPIRARSETDGMREVFSILDYLREAYLEDEHELFLASLRSGRSRSPSELLELGEGLIARGYVLEGIHLGWLASRSHTLNHPRVLRIVFPWPYRELIEEKARELDLDPYLLAGLIRQESAFTPGAISRAGAYGLMQLMPPTAREVARRIGADWADALLTVADANLHLGATHLAGLLRHYDGRVVPSLAAYNAGGTPVRRWLRSFGGEDPVRFIERVPYTETRGYLRTVLRNRALYKALYPAVPEETTGGR